MKISEIVKRLFEIEKQNNLFRLRIKGHKYWDYMRYHVYQEIEVYLEQNTWKTKEWKMQNMITRGLTYYAQIAKDLLRFVRDYWESKKKYDIVILSINDRVSSVDGKLVNIYAYPIIKHLCSQYNLLLIDTSQNDIKGKYPCDILRIRFLVFLRRLKSMFTRYSDYEKDTFSRLRMIIKEKFNFELDINNISHNIYSCIKESYKMYLGLFKRYKPKIAIYADNGSMSGMIDAAHKLGITVVELQHSMVSCLSIQYNYHDTNIECHNLAIPDYVFTFGEFWNSEFNLPSRKISVGFPYHEMIRKSISVKTAKNHKNVIIISTISSAKNLANIALELANLLPEYTIYYKLRIEEYPMWKERYPKEFSMKPNIVVIDNHNMSLYDYFSMCSYQIGTNSGALYEGLSFGLIIFILKTGHYYEDMKRLCDNGYAFLAANAEEIAEKIRKGERPKNSLDANDIFMENSLENIETAINSIMN